VNLGEELYLCALDDQGRAISNKLPYGLGGALLAELVLAGRIRVADAVVVDNPAPTGDGLVDEVLAGLQDPAVRSVPPASLMGNIGKNAGPRIWSGIVDGGLATVEQGGRSWMYFVRKPDRLIPTTAGEEPRARARAVLLGQATPDARMAALIGLVDVCDLVGRLVPREQRAAADERAAAIGEDQSVTEDVRQAIRGAQAAVAGQVHAAS
jgi:Golgi phosphoprotein 3 (GPP34)